MKSVAVVLSGGTGSRLGGDIPKQYIELAGKPVIVHTLEQLQRCGAIDGVVVTASSMWEKQILLWKEEFALTKLLAVALAGSNRQLSIRNGLLAAERFFINDNRSGVIIQHALRHLASMELLTRLIEDIKEAADVTRCLPFIDPT